MMCVVRALMHIHMIDWLTGPKCVTGRVRARGRPGSEPRARLHTAMGTGAVGAAAATNGPEPGRANMRAAAPPTPARRGPREYPVPAVYGNSKFKLKC